MAFLYDLLHRKNGGKITMEFSRRKSKHVLRKVKTISYPNHCTVLFFAFGGDNKNAEL